MADLPGFPSFPQMPSVPQMPAMDGMQAGGVAMPGQVNGNNSLAGTFSSMLQKVSDEIQTPHTMAKEMLSGKREYDTTELMMSMLQAEQTLNKTVRVLNQVVTGIRQLETIQV